MQTFLLKEKIAQYGDTQSTLGKALGLTNRATNYKINGHSQFKADEIKIIKNRYGLSDSEVAKIFFS